MQRNKGSVMQRKRDGRWYARLRVKDKVTGETQQIFRFARDKAHAERLLSQMIAEASGAGTEAPLSAFSEQPNTVTFRQLAHAYSEHRVTPAVYRNDRKVSGMRPEGERTTRIRIAVLVDYFGDTLVTAITVGSVEKFKAKRLATPTHHGTERQMASVNRELESLRAILRFARNEGIISASPFEKSSTPIISKSFETKRERVLTSDEETRLLEQCQKPRRAHLYPIVVAALDTGARKGELLALRWSDINALKRRITLRSMTTKTQKTRIVPLSGRFLVALYQMCGKVKDNRGGLPVVGSRDKA